MEESTPKRRGRQKGQTKKCTYIEDPLLGKYKIQIDEHSVNPMLKEGDKPLAYCNSVRGALKYIVKQQLVDKQSTLSLRGYITEINTMYKDIEKLIKA